MPYYSIRMKIYQDGQVIDFMQRYRRPEKTPARVFISEIEGSLSNLHSPSLSQSEKGRRSLIIQDHD